jgi:hypothetical protein
MAGIKFHAAIDTRIVHNRIHHAGRGIWFDWMTQGTHVSRNLFYDNDRDDIYVEVSHGPYLVDNNIFGSQSNVLDKSQGGAYVHNLFAGYFRCSPVKSRYTPYHLPHQTDVAGISIILSGDDRFYNNLFLPVHPDEKQSYGLAIFSKTEYYPSYADGNAYYNKALPFEGEQHPVVLSGFDPQFKIEDKGKEVYVSFRLSDLKNLQTELVTTERLGKAKLPKQAYEQPDGTPILFDTDYPGHSRAEHPVPGPFEQIKEGEVRLTVWK